jgi:hypothetical protein
MGQTPFRPLSMNVECFMHSSYIAMEFDRNWNKSREQGERKNKVVNNNVNTKRYVGIC